MRLLHRGLKDFTLTRRCSACSAWFELQRSDLRQEAGDSFLTAYCPEPFCRRIIIITVRELEDKVSDVEKHPEHYNAVRWSDE